MKSRPWPRPPRKRGRGPHSAGRRRLAADDRPARAGADPPIIMGRLSGRHRALPGRREGAAGDADRGSIESLWGRVYRETQCRKAEEEPVMVTDSSPAPAYDP